MTEGITYKEFISFKSIFYFCSLPLRLDSYRGCTFGCLYCFSQQLNNRESGFFKKVLPAEPEKLKTRFRNLRKENRDEGVINSCLRRGIPIHFGSVSDPFQPCESVYRVSKEILKILVENNYPTVISTKSSLILESEYFDFIRKLPVSIQISFSTLDDKLAKLVEPNAPLPSERIKIIDFFSSKGFYTVIRLQPYLRFNQQDIYKDICLFSSHGARHLILEHLRIPTNSSLKTRNNLWKNLGIDYLEEYKKLGLKKSRINYELNDNQKKDQILQIKKMCHENGMTFGSGDNDFHHVSDSFCCCGSPEIDGFQNIYEGHFGVIAKNAIHTKKIDTSLIENNWQPNGSIGEYINSHCRNKSLKNIDDYLHDRLASNEKSNTLDGFFGIEFDPENGYYVDKEKMDSLREVE